MLWRCFFGCRSNIQIQALLDDFSSARIDAGDSSCNAANQFVIERISGFSDFLSRDRFVAVLADQYDGILRLGLGNIGNVHHHLIHADSAENGTAFSVDQNLSAVGERARISVRISDGYGCHADVFFRDVGVSVADALMRIQRFDMRNVGNQLHGGVDIVKTAELRADILRWIQTVKDDALSDHIVIVLKG